MGSWNVTCALSHLPIMEGEKVYGLFLAKATLKAAKETKNYWKNMDV